MVEKAEEGAKVGSRKLSLLEEFAKDPAVQKFLEPGVPEPERRSYRLQEELLPSGEVVPPVRVPRHPETDKVLETLAMEGGFDDIKTALFLAGQLIRHHQWRTSPGSSTWNTLEGLAERVQSIGEAVRQMSEEK